MSYQSTIFVTGGAGFIGSEMVRNLVSDKNNFVVNIDSLTYSGNLDNLLTVANHSNYFFSNCAIGHKSSIQKLIKQFSPDIFINFAAESHVDKSIQDPNPFFMTNVMETLDFIIQVKDYWKQSHKKIIFHHISTDEVYGDIPEGSSPCDENYQYNPSSPYASSKAPSDHIVRSFHRTYGLPVLITNCSNNYGPFQFPEKLIPHMIINGIEGKSLPIYGDGMQIRDWLHVSDHICAIKKVIQNGKIGHTYNVGGINEQNNLSVVKKICAALDSLIDKKPSNIDSFNDLINFVDDRPGHDRRYAINCKKIMDDCGWKPLFDFDKGIEQTVRWYVENEKWWRKILSKQYKLERQGRLVK